jgi:hypothetical protein
MALARDLISSTKGMRDLEGPSRCPSHRDVGLSTKGMFTQRHGSTKASLSLNPDATPHCPAGAITVVTNLWTEDGVVSNQLRD